MPSAFKILVNPGQADIVLGHREYLLPMLNKYFEFIPYDSTATYNAADYAVMTNSINRYVENPWYTQLVNDGAKLIVDNTWEYHKHTEMQDLYKGIAYVCSSKKYFWINEYYIHCQAAYNSYQPNKNYTHLALLPIRQLKPHRRQLLTALGSNLDRLMYSTVEQGRHLPNDLLESQGLFQRYFNPDWYNNTYFSIVSETTTYSKYQLHITEKTFKPLAYYHPFVVFGQTGTLAYLHELGFETFENLFDESYDTVEDQATRLSMIVDNVNNFKETAYDSLTQHKLKHNYNLFYNTDKIEQMLVTEIVNPILEYVS